MPKVSSDWPCGMCSETFDTLRAVNKHQTKPCANPDPYPFANTFVHDLQAQIADLKSRLRFVREYRLKDESKKTRLSVEQALDLRIKDWRK